jgi:hypothetical protein
MTTKLGTYTFVNEPEIDFGINAAIVERQKYAGGTGLDYAGHGPLNIVLKGILTGDNCYTDRGTLITMLKTGNKVDFCSEAISYGTPGSPKSVYIRDMSFGHPVGRVKQVPFTISLEEET